MTRGLLLALALSLLSTAAHAQTARLDTLRHAAWRAPGDTRALCDLGWAELHAGNATDAATILHDAIRRLGASTTPALQRRLAECLYSYGRALERDAYVNWAPQAAIDAYTRSLALRPNAVVSARLAALVRMRASDWPEVVTEEDPYDDHPLLVAVRAFASDDAYPIVLTRRRDAATGREVALLSVSMTRGGGITDVLLIATRGRGGVWSIGSLGEVISTSGIADYDLHVAPGPNGSPTFVVLRNWGGRVCCEDRGSRWYSNASVTLAWRDASRTWRWGELDLDDAWRSSSLVVDEGGVVTVDRPSGRLDDRARRLVGTHPRDAWLAAP